MSYQEPLSRRAIAVSISESPDMASLGLAKEHLDDAMAEVARHLLAMGARLVYGGDLRPGGFTELLFELVTRHRRDADLNDDRVGVTNFLAWPVHIGLPFKEITRLKEALKGAAEVACLTLDGAIMPPSDRQWLTPRPPAHWEWAEGLTAMRKRMTKVSDARIVLGGRVEGFKGRMPGVAEEAIGALTAGQPLFVLGGFGGCARHIARDLGLTRDVANQPWPGRDELAAFAAEDLNNGLTAEENSTLATTPHIDQAMTLILRGLLRLP